MNQRPSGYEPDELPGCSTPLKLAPKARLERAYYRLTGDPITIMVPRSGEPAPILRLELAKTNYRRRPLACSACNKAGTADELILEIKHNNFVPSSFNTSLANSPASAKLTDVSVV